MLRLQLGLCVALAATSASAQSVISAKSGVVHYVEGDVTIDDQAVKPKFGQFPEVKNGQVLATTEGRSEVLLTPGAFLRLAENSSFRMVSNALADTRIQLLSGSALFEVAELLDNNAITVEYRDAKISLPKKGLYRFDSDSGTLRVYDGEARVNLENGNFKVKKNQEVDLDEPKLQAAKFDSKETDPFYRWSSRRASYIAAANVSSARTAWRSGYSSFGSGFFGRSYGSWTWNPFFGMYTFLPGSGVYASPFGWSYYSPGSTIGIYLPRTRPMTPLPMPVHPMGGVSGPPSRFGGGHPGVGGTGGGVGGATFGKGSGGGMGVPAGPVGH
jgi:hypothetical protein